MALSVRVVSLLMLCLLSLGFVAAQGEGLVVVDKPLVVEPGQPLSVSIYNGGSGVWSDLAITVQGNPDPVFYRDLLEPLAFGQVQVPIPFADLLDKDSLEVSLW